MPYLEVNQATIHYRIDGPAHGSPLVLSNSLAANLNMWEGQIPVLTAAGFKVLRYDSRGHGKSTVPDGDYSIEMLAADALALMDALGWERVHFCGLSKGGMVAQMLACLHPERLISLTLASTAAQLGTLELWNERIASARKGGMAALVDATIDRWFTAPGQQRLPQAVGRVRQMVVDTPVDGFCGCCAAIRDMDQRDAIGTIRLPTLILVGEHDPGTPVAASEVIHARIGTSQLVVISDAAHFIQIEQSKAFNDALLGFLSVTGHEVSPR